MADSIRLSSLKRVTLLLLEKIGDGPPVPDSLHSRPGHKLPRLRGHPDLLTLFDEERHADFQAGFERGGVGHASPGGVAAHAGLRLPDRQLHMRRQLPANGLPFYFLHWLIK